MWEERREHGDEIFWSASKSQSINTLLSGSSSFMHFMSAVRNIFVQFDGQTPSTGVQQRPFQDHYHESAQAEPTPDDKQDT